MTRLAIVKSNSSSEGAPRWTDDIRLEGKRACKALDESYFVAAGVLYELETRKTDNGNHAWELWENAEGAKYKSFGDAVWSEFGLKPERATRFIRIYYRLNVQMENLDPVLRGRLVSLGFSKLSILARILTLKNAEFWADYASKATVTFLELHNRVREAADLVLASAARKSLEAKQEKSHVKDVVTDPDDDSTVEESPAEKRSKGELVDPQSEGPGVPTEMKERYIRRSFSFTDESWRVVDDSLTRMRQVTKQDNDGYNLSLICLQYLADAHYGTADDYDKALRTLLQTLESKMGVKMVAIDPKKNEIVYGYSSLRAMSTSGPSDADIEEAEAEANEIDGRYQEGDPRDPEGTEDDQEALN